jgi:hypothetical protein
MKIKRFYESEEQKNISSERVEEILKIYFSVKIGRNKTIIDSLLTELSSYKIYHLK